MYGFSCVGDLRGGPEAWGCTALDNNCGEQAIDACPECLVAHCWEHMKQQHDTTCSRFKTATKPRPPKKRETR